MTVEVQAPDGSTIEFPDGTDSGVIHNVMSQHFGGGPRSTATGAALAGALDTGAMGFYDELRGFHEASDLPSWVDKVPFGGVAKAIGGAYNVYAKGGPYRTRYEEGRDIARQALKTAEQEHPSAYLGGQVGGGLTSAVMAPGFRAAEGAGALARMGAAAKTGGLYGAAYGAGESEGGLAETAREAAIGGATGAGLGAVASPLMDVASHAAGLGLGKLGSVYQAFRTGTDANFTDREAVRRIQRAMVEDYRAGQARLQPEDADIARRAGIPLVAADWGGPAVHNTAGTGLARSAANISPEAGEAMREFAGGRFADQNERAVNFIRELTGGGNATQELERLQQEARRANAPAYRRAYEAGDRPVWSPELERLTNSPDIQAAMKSAVRSGQSRAVEEGFGGFNPGVSVTPDGRILFGQSYVGGAARGVPTYPNIQYWDYVGRDLRDMVEKVQGREPDKARYLNSLSQQLNTELDRLVPEYQEARVGAWRNFQARDALEAGQNFASGLRGSNSDYGRDIARMTDGERELFARGYSSTLADNLLKLRDGVSIDRAFLTSKSAMQRHAMALGPDRARQLEAYLRVENIADRFRTSFGNSTTAAQLQHLGLAAGGLGAAALGEHFGGEQGLGIGAGLAIAAHLAQHRMTASDRAVAARIGRLLVSNDPRLSRRAIEVIASRPGLMDAVRNASRQDFGMTLTRAATTAAQSQLQGPAVDAINAITGGPYRQ